MKPGNGIRAAWILGLAGLIPFAVGAVVIWMPDSGAVTTGSTANVLSDYAACILSFLGGVRWGADIPREKGPRAMVLALAVIPPLIAWTAVCLTPFTGARIAFVVLVGAFAVQGVWDARSTALPHWMGTLRSVLTLGALACLVSAVLAT